MAEYYKIGKLVAVHGLQGELLLKHELGKKTSLKGLNALFIEEKKQSFLPWFIESSRVKNEQELYLKFEGINSREDALRLAHKEVWMTETDFKKFAAKSSPVNLLGYEIINTGKSLGPVLEVIEQPHQLLCRLEIDQKEVLVPLNDAFLKNINHRKKQVEVELPEGLLDVYLT